MGGLEVRDASIADAFALGLIGVRSWQAAYAGIVPDDVLAALDPAERAEQWRTRLTDPGRTGTTFVAVADGAVIGFVSVGPYRNEQDAAPHAPDAGEVYALYVDPERWRTGVGRALMTSGLTHLMADGPRPVHLWVLADNRSARAFYQRCGFTADGATSTFTVHGPDGAATELAECRLTLAPAHRRVECSAT